MSDPIDPIEAINLTATRFSVDGVVLEPNVPAKVADSDAVRELAASGALRLEAATDFDKLHVDELQDEADRRGLTVKGTGQDGRVLKADLIAALSDPTAHREE